MAELVSIIVPVYQAESHLDTCIGSILQQTYKYIEVLLIDDGSTDESGRICDKYAASDSRVLVIHQKNGGVSSARNTGLNHMRGSYLVTVDADDYIHPDMVETLLAELLSTNGDVAVCGFEMFFEEGQREKHCPMERYEGSIGEFMEAQFISLYDSLLIQNQNNKMYRSSVIEQANIRYDESMSINEDIWFSVSVIHHSRRIVLIPEIFLYYRQYNTSQSLVTGFYKNGVESCFWLNREIQQCMKDHRVSSGVKNRINNRMIFHICGFLGITYRRSPYTNQECFIESKKLACSEEFQILINETKTEGFKNKIAVFLLKRKLFGIYHMLCLCFYRRLWKQNKRMEEV